MPVSSFSTLTLGHLLEQGAAKFGDHAALAWPDGSFVSYMELLKSARELGAVLSGHGLATGDTVAILAENSPNWVIAYFAITAMGAVAVPILTEFHGDAVAHILRHSESKAVFVSQKLLSKIEDMEFTPAPILFGIETFEPIDREVRPEGFQGLKNTGLTELKKWRDAAAGLGKTAPSGPGEDDLAAIVYTSGTMGHSKAVMLSHKNIVFDAASVHSIVQIGKGDRLLSILPLPHTYECTLGLALPLLHGATIHYMDKPPTARALQPVLQKVKPTVMLTVPLVMEKIYKTRLLPKFTGSRLMRALYKIPFFRKRIHRSACKKLIEFFGGHLRLMPFGGAPIAQDVEAFMLEAGFPYAVGYGLTEAAPIVSGTGPGNTRLFSVGYALPGMKARIASPEAGGHGEIEVTGPNVMRGYFKDPQRTAETFTSDGWLKTGDLGCIDEDGYIFIKGRCKNVILGPSGENIYPEEIESVFFASACVLEVLVYEFEGKVAAKVHLDANAVDELYGGLPDDQLAGKILDLLEEIRQEVNSKVSSFARVHKVFEQKEPFEKTPTQKIKRYLYVESLSLA